MNTAAGIVELISRLAAVDISSGDVESCSGVLQDYSRVIAWAEHGKIAVAARLEVLAVAAPEISPEHLLASATRVSLGEALQSFDRAAAVEVLPDFSAALGDGSVSAAHVDVIADAVGKLDADEQQRLAGRSKFLAAVAGRTTPREFARTVRNEALRCQRGDGTERLQRQRRATYLKTWVDQASGMVIVHGEFDPESGAILMNRLSDTVETLFHDQTPSTCPSDPLEKQHHLRGLALVALTDGKRSGKNGGIDMSILIDAKTLVDGAHLGSVIDCGLPIELPVETMRRMACVAEITPIIVGADGVHLELGRSTRLATAQQRKALRPIYKGCAIPGCSVGWDHVVVHHVVWYRNGGFTDVSNLLPLCSRHHHLAHEGGWQLAIDRQRNLTITTPDGTSRCHSPPKILAA